jgi:hypothetical protein
MAMKMISANVMQRENGKRASKNLMNANASGWTRMQLDKHLLAKENHHFSDIADSRQIPFIMLHRERLRAAQMMLNQRLPTMPGGMQPR